MFKRLPLISVVIPTYNGEKYLKKLIPSLAKQTYPKSKIEYLLINDGSTDKSRNLAKKFGMKIMDVNTHDIELNKGTGMHAAKGDYLYWLDHDMELCSNDFFQLLIAPFLEEPKIIGAFTKEFALDCGPRENNSLLRYISYDNTQRDPVYQFFSKSIESTVAEDRNNYFLCKFIPGKIPAVGRILYNKSKLLKTPVGKDKSFIDLESTESVSRAGYQLFAYVPRAKIKHYHAINLTQLIGKRLRNLERDFLPNIHNKNYTWFNVNEPTEILRIAGWIIYANLFIPAMILGLLKSLKYHDLAFMWEPIVTLLVTDAIVWGFISKSSGRRLIGQMLARLLAYPFSKSNMVG